MKKTVCLLLCAVILVCLCGCSESDSSLPGTGTPDVTESFDWSEYDAIIEEARHDTDLEHRSELLHQAEELVMQTGAVIPLLRGQKQYLLKSGVTGVYVTETGLLVFNRIRLSGAKAERPLQVAVCGEPASLDYVIKMASDVGIMVSNTSAGLMYEDEAGQYICDMAESYEISDDGLTYTFHLRDDLRWSDGAPLDADDFIFSWKRAAAAETAAEAGFMFDVIRGYPDNLDLTASDGGMTLKVVLDQPCAYFLSMCANPSYFPVYQKQVEEAKGYKGADGKLQNPGAWASEGNVVTCGAYTVEQWNHNESIIFKKNPYYFKASEVYTETIHLMLTSDSTTAYNAFAADSIVLTDMIPEDIIGALKNGPEYHSKPSLTTTNIGFNIKSPLFAGMSAEEAKIFRRAVGYTVDRTFLSQVATSGNSEPAVSVVPPRIGDGTGSPFGDGYEYSVENGYYSVHADLDKARDLLRSIGFEFNDDGKLETPITVDYLFNGSGSNTAIAACLQADLAQLGIRLNLSQMEWNVYLGERNHASTESFRDAWTADFNDPYGILCVYTSYSSNNHFRLGK